MMFGIFGLGDDVVGSMKIGNSNFAVNCLTPMTPPVKRRASAEERACGIMEPGVVYQVDTWWRQEVPVPTTPDQCCNHCKDEVRCKSWVWNGGFDSTSCELLGGYPEDDV